MSSPFDKRLVLVVGKGGVGRSTVAASIAAASARRGRKTLLYEFNANDRFGDFFGRAQPVGEQIVRLRENLHAVNTSPAAALHEYGLMVLRFERVYKMVFENRVSRAFIRAIPGLDDYSILGKAWYHTTEERGGRPIWDTLVFDMAASGHSLSMLRIPKVILETVPEGPLTRDARTLIDLLRDPARTAIVLTTLAEEMPVNEARELTASLDRELGLRVSHLVVNQIYPDHAPVGSPVEAVLDRLLEAEALPPELEAVRDHANLGRRRRRLSERYLAELAEAIDAPRAELPLLFSPSLGPDEIEQLSQTLDSQLG